MLQIVQRKLASGSSATAAETRFIQGNLFLPVNDPSHWRSSLSEYGSYDLVFLGFFISHVPPSKMKDFLRLCCSALKPGGTLMMIDNHYAHTETVQVPRHSDRAVQWDPAVQDDAHYVITRNLKDGSEHKIVKIAFPDGALAGLLVPLGFEGVEEKTKPFHVARFVKSRGQ